MVLTVGLPRISQDQADAVDMLRAEGKRPRQIETMLGLTYGILSGRYVIGEDARPVFEQDRRDGRGWHYPPKPRGDS